MESLDLTVRYCNGLGYEGGVPIAVEIAARLPVIQ
jgi:hypothetical protein